jgi:transcriptional regulator with XRE-family HTH domain
LAKKPLNSAYPKTLVSLGDHLRKRRLDLGLFQKDVAVTIGVDTCTVTNWERGNSKPELRLIPKIAEFLRYEPPHAQPETLGERIKHYRYVKGVTQKERARQIGIDPTTLSRMERDRGRSSPSVLRRVMAFLEACSGTS